MENVQKTAKRGGRRVLKMIGILFLIFLIILMVYLFIPTPYSNNADKLGDTNMSKLMSLQKEADGDIAPLENVEIRTIDVSYIMKNETVDTRPMWFYEPVNVEKPLPVVYIPHYEMTEDALELRTYLAQGWAVASPANVKNEYNGKLTDDDLVFNNAALYTLRHMSEVDNQRIVLVGGSAGGYMTLMLNALQMGNTASVANSPISNIYFNLNQYFMSVKEINRFWMPRVYIKGLTGMLFSENKTGTLIKSMLELPIPFVGMTTGVFEPNLDNFPDKEDVKRWESFSPVALADDFSSPIAINHNTSDVLVPVDQTTREFVKEPGETMPKGFSTALNENNPGVLGHSLVDELPSELTTVNLTVIENPDIDTVMPYDISKMFNINIYDDGPTQSYGSHSSVLGSGTWDVIDYVKANMEKTLAETEQPMPGKLLLLLERYQGNSVQLPAHVGVDDTVYGSLEIYRKEVVDELNVWMDHHSVEQMDKAMREAISSISDETERLQYTQAWGEIKKQR